MVGQVTLGQSDPVLGFKDDAAIPIVLSATINIQNLNGFLADASHRGDLSGHLYSPRLGGVLPSTGGEFHLFSPGRDSRSNEMVYELDLVLQGKPCRFCGRKYLHIAPAWSVWRATTTLYVTLLDGPPGKASIIAAGILKLKFLDLLATLGTLHATKGESWRQRWVTVLQFFRFFSGELWRIYILHSPNRRELETRNANQT
jgi:cholesterol oxidase